MNRRMPAALWLAAALPRAVLFGLLLLDGRRGLRGDSLGYLELARGVFRGVFPETFRTPGYPFFLAPFSAMFHSPELPAAFVQCLLGVWTVVIAWRWFEGLAGRAGAVAGAAVLALDPVLVLHTPLILTETLFTFLATAAAAGTWKASDGGPRPARAAVCGAWWGLASMVKPVCVYLPLAVCALWRRDKKSLAAFLLAAYLLPGAWTARNWNATGFPVFSSVGGFSLLRYPAAGVESLRTGRPWEAIDQELRDAEDRAHPAGYSSDAEKSGAYARAALPILKAHPLLLAEYWARGMARVLSGTGLEMILEWLGADAGAPAERERRSRLTGQGTLGILRRHPGLIPVQLAYMLALAALYGLAILGFRRLWRGGDRARAVFLLGSAAYFLVLSGSQGYYRYRIPMLPFLAAAASAAFPKFKSEPS